MEIRDGVLTRNEQITLALRSLYAEKGYRLYRMSRFEELGLYTENRDFLVSPDIITFTDKKGRLLALKPDVTLSIVKSRKDDETVVDRLCYSESVFRIPKEADSFREISQTGVECIGNIGKNEIADVIALAAMSLDLISNANVIVLSDLDILNSFISGATEDPAVKKTLLELAGRKNVSGISRLVREGKISEEKAGLLSGLVSLSGNAFKVLPELSDLCAKAGCSGLFDSFEETVSAVAEKIPSGTGKIKIDFSVTGDFKYYNGIFFKGFIKNVPQGVLSGGQYDGLMSKLGKRSRAIGFAVRTDITGL